MRFRTSFLLISLVIFLIPVLELGVLPDVQCPVLIINGGHSGPQFELMAEVAMDGLGEATREVFPQSTHFVPMEAPDALAARILSFGEDDRGAP